MLLANKQVAIIGGGPGGLTLARLLQRKGVAVTVYERDIDKTGRQQGATLDLHDDTGLKALQEAGLLDEFKKYYRPGADKLRITDSHASICYDDQADSRQDTFGQEAFRPEIDRGPLRELLMASLADGTIVWNAPFVALKPSGPGHEIVFDAGNTAYADVVIAADGANSRVRKYITAIAPIFSGVTVVEGTINRAATNAPKLWALTNGGKVFALGGSKTLILSAKGDGSLSFYTGTKETEGWIRVSGIDFDQRASVLGWFKDRFADWSTDWHELFDTADSYFVPRPQYHYPLDQCWEPLPSLTIIGDAAHRMPPYAGEGVNQAMADALDLYDALCCSPFGTVHEAIASFERRMCERAAGVTAETLENTERMHAEGALADMVHFFAGDHA
jgi:2-polyprenyl-6-methoxyphenol hydroxylase-like FAD-dependent oxidoreductase